MIICIIGMTIHIMGVVAVVAVEEEEVHPRMCLCGWHVRKQLRPQKVSIPDPDQQAQDLEAAPFLQ